MLWVGIFVLRDKVPLVVHYEYRDALIQHYGLDKKKEPVEA